MIKNVKDELEGVPVVNEVVNVIPEDLPGLLPDREIACEVDVLLRVAPKGTISDAACGAEGITNLTAKSAQQRFLSDLVIHHGMHQCF